MPRLVEGWPLEVVEISQSVPVSFSNPHKHTCRLKRRRDFSLGFIGIVHGIGPTLGGEVNDSLIRQDIVAGLGPKVSSEEMKSKKTYDVDQLLQWDKKL